MKGESCCTVGCIAKILLIVGGLNWGLVGAGMLAGKGSAWNLVSMLVGTWPMVEAIVYALVGVAALLALFSWSKCCGGNCSAGNCSR
jgi:uncharacterized membrane protein YuzA (DUF378 family)